MPHGKRHKMTQSDTLTAKQAKLITALNSSRNITIACKRAGVSRKTFYRWLNDEVFYSALKQVQDQVLEETSLSLTAGLNTALEVLYQIMVEGDINNVRRNASNDWIGHTVRLKEHTDTVKRIEELERFINDQ